MSHGVGRAPILSVILPAYNAKLFVEQAVLSILQQSFSDFELIIVDDGSVDGTTDILERLASVDERLVLISRENRGLVASLNEGLDIARGEFIARMDADDIALPTRFAEQLNFLRDTEYDLCGTSVECFGNRRHLWHFPATPEEVEVHLLFDSPYAHPSVMCKALVYKTLRYREDFASAEDFDLWERAWQLGFRGANIQKPLLNYRVHASQVSNTQKIQQQVMAESVRRRHWWSVTGNLYGAEIQRLLDIFREGVGDLATVKPLLHAVLQQYRGPAQALFADHAFRIGVRAAASSQHPWRVWRDLLEGCGMRRSRWQELVLFAVWAFGLTSDSLLYSKARRWYLNRKWR